MRITEVKVSKDRTNIELPLNWIGTLARRTILLMSSLRWIPKSIQLISKAAYLIPALWDIIGIHCHSHSFVSRLYSLVILTQNCSQIDTILAKNFNFMLLYLSRYQLSIAAKKSKSKQNSWQIKKHPGKSWIPNRFSTQLKYCWAKCYYCCEKLKEKHALESFLH